MSDSFRFLGSYSSTPLFGVLSAFPTISAPIDESVQVNKRLVDTVLLDTDGTTPLGIGGLTEVNVLVLKVVGEPIELTLVSDLGTAVIPVDTFFTIFAISAGFTALSVERTPGVETYVEVFMGQRA